MRAVWLFILFALASGNDAGASDVLVALQPPPEPVYLSNARVRATWEWAQAAYARESQVWEYIGELQGRIASLESQPAPGAAPSVRWERIDYRWTSEPNASGGYDHAYYTRATPITAEEWQDVEDSQFHWSIPPEQLAVAPIADAKLTLTWSDNSVNESGFIIERAPLTPDFEIGVSSDWAFVATVPANTEGYVDAVQLGTTWQYRVAALSGWSNAAAGEAVREPDPPTWVEVMTIARINCGRGNLTDPDGLVWVEDGLPDGTGAVSTHSQAIAETALQALFKVQRHGDFALEVPVEFPGRYRVRVWVAEAYFNQPVGSGSREAVAGRRVWDTQVEGETRVAGFDILAHVPADTAFSYSIDVDINDGALSIAFASIKDRATISGVEVVRLEAR